MTITFPNSPVTNQEYQAQNGLTYIWDGEKWSSRSAYNVDNNYYVEINGGNSAIFAGPTEVGINTLTPASTLDVEGDIEVSGSSANGLILLSPNGTRFRVTIDDSGNLSASSV